MYKNSIHSLLFSAVCSSTLFGGKLFIARRLFGENQHFLFQRFPPFIFKYRAVHMTEVTLKANNFIDICSIPSKFHMCMYDRMKNIYAQNQTGIYCSGVWKAVHNRTFWKTLAHVYHVICNRGRLLFQTPGPVRPIWDLQMFYTCWDQCLQN